jgi:hypothetical protein
LGFALATTVSLWFRAAPFGFTRASKAFVWPTMENGVFHLGFEHHDFDDQMLCGALQVLTPYILIAIFEPYEDTPEGIGTELLRTMSLIVMQIEVPRDRGKKEVTWEQSMLG